jgi:hypothetical protein
MENLKYKQLLSQSDEQKNEQDTQFKVKEAELALNSDILATERSLSEAKRAVLIAKSTFPLDSQGILNAQSNVEAYENGLKKLNELKGELF